MFVDTIASKCVRTFWDLDLAELNCVEQGKHVEVWVVKTFDEFQKFKGFALTKSIGKLLKENVLRHFVNMFIMFIL
jgi:hypothetical protein